MNSSLLLTLGIFPLFSTISTTSLLPTRVSVIKIVVYVPVFWLGSGSLIQHFKNFFSPFFRTALAVWVLSHGGCVWPRGLAPTQLSPATAGKNCWDFRAAKHYVGPLALPHPSWALPLNKPYPLAIYGYRAFQGILLGWQMRKVAEGCTCRNQCGLAFHWELPSFAIGFSYGTCYREAQFGCRWLAGIVVLTEVDSASEENAATGATKGSTVKSTENWIALN